ncbi:MAG: hypothetical protein M1828_006868 [Chrysothrix sp. TS-e1954]|nr:MAG: hypothetical protein M1828_006868 [Chrysothrix sp. TS-e1954]
MPSASTSQPTSTSTSTTTASPTMAQSATLPPTGPTPPPDSNPTASTPLSTLLADLNRTPLFMTTLDPTDGSTGTNPGLDALRALAYEGTPSEVARNFRTQGNECVSESRWGDARDFYTQGLDWLAGKGRQKKQRGENGRMDGGEGEAEVDWLESMGKEGEERVVDVEEEERVVDVEEEEREQKREQELGRVNRARVNIELENYGQACRDCAAALLLNNRNVKALYRSALALGKLEKLDQALNAIAATLEVDASNPAAKKLQVQITERQVKAAKKEQERLDRERRKAQEGMTLRQAILQRKWTVRGAPAADMQDARLQLSEPLDKDSELSLPVLLVYPTASQTELIKSVSESHTLGQHLEEILPVPWDPDGKEFGVGTGEKVDLFVDRPEGGLSKVGKKVKIGKVLSEGRAVVEAGMARIYVVPKGRVDDWIAEEKKRRKI